MERANPWEAQGSFMHDLFGLIFLVNLIFLGQQKFSSSTDILGS